MTGKEYPFTKLRPDDLPRPLLPLQIINPATQRAINYWGMIDTGADTCTFPAFIAQALGHRFERGLSPQRISTASGISLCYLHTCTVKIFDYENGITDFSIPVFTIENRLLGCLNYNGPMLLGVKHFLENFILKIDYRRKMFSFHKP